METVTTLTGFARLVIDDAQIVCAAGTDPAQVLADAMGGFSHAREQEGWFTNVNVADAIEITAVDIDGIESMEKENRIREMLLRWLKTTTWPEQAPRDIYLLAPTDISGWLNKKLPFENTQLKWFSALLPCLTEWNEQLEKQPETRDAETETTLFLAVDSQIQPEPWYDQRGDLYHEKNQDGRLVGEGLAALWLRKQKPEAQPVFYCQEPKANAAAEDTTTALKTLFDQFPTDRLAAVLTNHNHSRLHACELYYFTSQVTVAKNRTDSEDDDENELDDNKTGYHFPRPIEPALTDAPSSINASLGDIGLAALPMQLALIHFSQRYGQTLLSPRQALIHLSAHDRFYWPITSTIENQNTNREATK